LNKHDFFKNCANVVQVVAKHSMLACEFRVFL
jgi:hypothetical protein